MNAPTPDIGGHGAPLAARLPDGRLPWVEVAPEAPYFMTETGEAWHPVGQNDAISWVELKGLFRRRNVAAVEAYLERLAAHGVTCMRLMLEYAQVRHRYFENPAGCWAPNMVRYWDDLFALCERHGIRILLTPFDTFWMWLHFRHHPYNARRGGPLDHPSRVLISPEAREAIKARLTFAAERWGGSGVLFAWDLWNEIHPAQAEMSAEPFGAFIADLSAHLRGVEMRAHGRTHPQTVSLFGPELVWRAPLKMEGAIFRHPALDFASIHIYEQGTIDDPRNTVDAAVSMGRIVRDSLAEIGDRRPFFDSEHGPIHRFKDRHRTLPAIFDDEYFRHMQWAHLASGAAGGGMRWPNRNPHVLTPGMRLAQRGLSRFLPLIDWVRFERRNASGDVRLTAPGGEPVEAAQVERFCCASDDQAVVYLLRRDRLTADGRLDAAAEPLPLRLQLPLLRPGSYHVTAWNTVSGEAIAASVQEIGGELCCDLPPLVGDMALALRAAS
jgi:hypothetical protein